MRFCSVICLCSTELQKLSVIINDSASSVVRGQLQSMGFCFSVSVGDGRRTSGSGIHSAAKRCLSEPTIERGEQETRPAAELIVQALPHPLAERVFTPSLCVGRRPMPLHPFGLCIRPHIPKHHRLLGEVFALLVVTPHAPVLHADHLVPVVGNLGGVHRDTRLVLVPGPKFGGQLFATDDGWGRAASAIDDTVRIARTRASWRG